MSDPAASETASPARIRPGAAHAVGLIALIGASAALYATRPAMITPLGALLSLATMWLGLVPAAVYLLRRDGTAPFFPLVGLFYAFCFGLAPFLLPFAWPGAPPLVYWHGNMVLGHEPTEALALASIGTASLVAAFYLFRPRWETALPALRITERSGAGGASTLLWALFAAHAAYMLIPALRRVPSIGQFLDPVGYVMATAFAVLVLSRRLTGVQALLALLALVALAALRVSLFVLTPIMLFVLALFMALARRHLRGAVIAAVVAAGVVLPAYQFTSDARWAGPDFSARGTVLVDKVARYWEGERRSGEAALETLLRRLSLVWLLGHVTEKSPGEVPYWRGETYKPLFTSVIPRALWPGKPEERTGGTFGRRYGLIGEGSITSVNLPWLVELYVNFGPPGVPLGMIVIGAFLALLDRLLNRAGASELEYGVGAGILVPLTFQESNFSLMVGSLPLFVLCVYLYFNVGQRLLARLGPWRPRN